MRDRSNGTTERVSVKSNGSQTQTCGSTGGSAFPAITPDGRFVAFTSGANDLVAGDTNGFNDVFIHDRQTGETALISVDASGSPLATGVRPSQAPAISADGRFVAFVTGTLLAASDTNNLDDVYVRDRQSGTTEIVSVDSAGNPAAGSLGRGSDQPSISPDGRLVAFLSDRNLAGTPNSVEDVFVRDRQAGTTQVVSVSSARRPPMTKAVISGTSRRPR